MDIRNLDSIFLPASRLILPESHPPKAIGLLKQLQPQTPQSYPNLSVIIPACNEGATLEQALITLLKQDYPSLEIILVDDRSTDNTGSLINQMAAQDDRIVPVQITLS